VATKWKKLPSKILKIKDEYAAYCLDEVCAHILNRLEDGEEIDEGSVKSSLEMLMGLGAGK